MALPSESRFNPEELKDWLGTRSKTFSVFGHGNHHPIWQLVDSHLARVSTIDPNEWYQRVQLEAILFNMGAVVSFNCFPVLEMTRPSSDELLKLHFDVMAEIQSPSSEWWKRPIPTLYAIAFFRRFFQELHEQICKNRSSRTKSLTGSSAAALSVWLMQKFGMSEPFSVAMATFIIITAATAARTAFCEISSDEFIKAISSEQETGT